MSYTGFATLEYQINLHDDYEARLEQEQEQREQMFIEDEEYALTPGGHTWKTGTYYQTMDDMSDTGDWVNIDTCETCSHGMPVDSMRRKPYPAYHLNIEENRWELCPDFLDYEENRANPRIPATCDAWLG